MEYKQFQVLGNELIATWKLGPHEVDYINRQQGDICFVCKSNLRCRTLAAALLDNFDFAGTLQDFCTFSRRASTLDLLEINEAGQLTSFLKHIHGHTLARYPDVDMQALPYTDDCWDVVLHSDVLEHIQDPLLGLRECHRVLVPGGVLLYTIPIIHGRLSSSRHRMPESFHGAPGETQSDWLVHTEYGADFWLQPISAGFKKMTLFSLGGPESVTVVCKK